MREQYSPFFATLKGVSDLLSKVSSSICPSFLLVSFYKCITKNVVRLQGQRDESTEVDKELAKTDAKDIMEVKLVSFSAFVRSFLPSVPSSLFRTFLRSHVRSFLRTFVPSCVRSSLSSLFRSFVRLYVNTSVPSFRPFFVPSNFRYSLPSLRSFVSSYLRTFVPW